MDLNDIFDEVEAKAEKPWLTARPTHSKLARVRKVKPAVEKPEPEPAAVVLATVEQSALVLRPALVVTMGLLLMVVWTLEGFAEAFRRLRNGSRYGLPWYGQKGKR